MSILQTSDVLVAPAHAGQMEGAIKKARKRQRKALKALRKTQKVTNNQYRKNTRTERGLDFASQNNAKIGDMLVNTVGSAVDGLKAWATGGTSVAADMMNGPPTSSPPSKPWVAPVVIGAGVVALGVMLR